MVISVKWDDTINIYLTNHWHYIHTNRFHLGHIFFKKIGQVAQNDILFSYISKLSPNWAPVWLSDSLIVCCTDDPSSVLDHCKISATSSIWKHFSHYFTAILDQQPRKKIISPKKQTKSWSLVSTWEGTFKVDIKFPLILHIKVKCTSTFHIYFQSFWNSSKLR